MTPQIITIPANGVFTVHVKAKYFLVTALTGSFNVLTSGGEEYDFTETGSGFGNDQSPEFGKLTFYDKSGSQNTVTFYASLTPIKTSDVNVTSTVTVQQQPITNTLAGCTLENEGQLNPKIAVANTAVAFAAAGTYFRRAIIIAQKDLNQTANTGVVYVGNAANHQPYTLNPGDLMTLEADTGAKRDFGSWYLLGANVGDGLAIMYV